MVLDNWERENPDQYNQFANGPAAQYSTPGRVLFNPEGEKNIGLGRGGLQDYGITWYSTQGSADNDLSKAPYDPKIALNVLLNGKYLQTEQGMARAMAGESPVPYRYMGDKEGNPSSEGTYAYGYERFSEIPAAVRRDFGLTGAAAGDPVRKGKGEKKPFAAAETYRQRFDEMKQRFSKATAAATPADEPSADPAQTASAPEKPRVSIGLNRDRTRTRASDIGTLYGSAKPSGAARLSAGIGSGNSLLSKFKDDLRASDGLGLGKRGDIYGQSGADYMQPIRSTRGAKTASTGGSAAYYSKRFG